MPISRSLWMRSEKTTACVLLPVTSDNLIRLSALRSGVLRTSSKEFVTEVEDVLHQIDELLKKTNENAHSTKVKDGKL